MISFTLLVREKLRAIVDASMNRSCKIEFLSLMIVIAFTAAVIFHYILAYYFAAVSPRNSFILYTLGGQFGDLNISLFQDKTFAPYDQSLGVNRAQYFPFSYVLIYPLTLLGRLPAIIVYSLIFIVGMFWYVCQHFSDKYLPFAENRMANFKNIFIISFMSYPFLFAIERGNLENILFLLIALSFYFYSRERRSLSAFFLGMAGAMKLYPLFFVLYFLSEKRYFETVLSLVFFIILTIGSLLILKPGFHENIIGWFTALTGLGKYILFLPDTCTHYNVGLWGFMKTISSKWLTSDSLPALSVAYHIIVAVMLPIISIFILFLEKISWRKLALVVCSVLLFPEMSNDYKLLLLYLPLAAFVNAKPQKGDYIYAILFAILIIPKNYYWVQGDIGIANLINPVVLLIMMVSLMGSHLFKHN